MDETIGICVYGVAHGKEPHLRGKNMFLTVIRRLGLNAMLAAVLIPTLAVAQAQAQGSPYRIGLKIAQSRHYSDPDCYARVFVRHAHPDNHPNKRNYWSARTGPAFKGELWSECRISR